MSYYVIATPFGLNAPWLRCTHVSAISICNILNYTTIEAAVVVSIRFKNTLNLLKTSSHTYGINTTQLCMQSVQYHHYWEFDVFVAICGHSVQDGAFACLFLLLYVYEMRLNLNVHSAFLPTVCFKLWVTLRLHSSTAFTFFPFQTSLPTGFNISHPFHFIIGKYAFNSPSWPNVEQWLTSSYWASSLLCTKK